MKIMYIGSNPSGAPPVRLESEITELQRIGLHSSGGIEFLCLPSLPFEDFEQQLALHDPDILHIASHGEEHALLFSDSKNTPVEVTAEVLKVFFSYRPPRLIYINACNSEQIAKQISGQSTYAIGTNAPITHFAARKGAVCFYRMLARGASLADAFDASSATIKVLSARNNPVETRLYPAGDARAKLKVFHEPTRLVARFRGKGFEPSAHGGFYFDIGLAGCHPDTTQLVICTDDETFEPKKRQTLEDAVTSVERSTCVAGEIWLSEPWGKLYGDFRLFALATTAGGKCYCCSATLIEALRNYYTIVLQLKVGDDYPKELKDALALLRENDGALLRPHPGSPTRGGKAFAKP